MQNLPENVKEDVHVLVTVFHTGQPRKLHHVSKWRRTSQLAGQQHQVLTTLFFNVPVIDKPTQKILVIEL
jgi:hypothetical protein